MTVVEVGQRPRAVRRPNHDTPRDWWEQLPREGYSRIAEGRAEEMSRSPEGRRLKASLASGGGDPRERASRESDDPDPIVARR